jgi:prefoldin subunit 5
MTQNEALSFIEKKDAEIQTSIDKQTERATYIKENIQFLLSYMQGFAK